MKEITARSLPTPAVEARSHELQLTVCGHRYRMGVREALAFARSVQAATDELVERVANNLEARQRRDTPSVCTKNEADQ